MTTTARAILTVAVAGVAAAGLAPAAAHAGGVTAEPATQSVCHLGDCTLTVSRLSFAAEVGERNAVTLVRDGDVYTVRDTGAPITAGTGCTQVDPQTARCELARAQVSVSLGDEDDALDAAPDRGLAADGGPGADRLTGGAGGDLLVGGAGPDELRGGEGGDALWGDSAYSLQAFAGDDVLDGGAGRDTAVYTGRDARIVANLAEGVAGQADERDALVGVEDVAGGNADDLLIGDAGGNRLEGGGGRDELHGGDGADFLQGEEDADRLLAGAGDDWIDADEPVAAGACGPGRDVIDSLISVDLSTPNLVLPDCERIRMGYTIGEGPTLGLRPFRRTARHLLFAFTCPEGSKGSDCTVEIDVWTAGRRRVKLASGFVEARPGTRRIAVRLTRAGRRLLRRSCPRLRIEETDAATHGWVIPKRGAGARPLWCRKRFR